VILAALLLSSHPAPVAQPAHPTARETFTGCGLLVRDVYPQTLRTEWSDANGCYWVAVRALSEHSIDASDDRPDYVIRRPRFCPPSSLGLSVHNIRPLASAYLLYFRGRARQIGDRPAMPVFLAAMVERWPCRGRR
jgi:hypothetical protein